MPHLALDGPVRTGLAPEHRESPADSTEHDLMLRSRQYTPATIRSQGMSP